MRSILIKITDINDKQLRSGGLIFAFIGFVIIWLMKNEF